MTALSLAAVDGLDGESGVALTADHLFALELAGERGERRLNLDRSEAATTEAEDEMERGFLLDVIVLEGPAVFKLLSGEDQTLLIRRDTFFVLDLGPLVKSG